MGKLGWVRVGLYCSLLIFSFLLFALACARINYTLHLSPSDPLNGGRSFYDPVIPELIVTTFLTMGWSGLSLFLFFRDSRLTFLQFYRDELIGLVVFWLLWTGGAAAASSIWGDLSFCQQFQACQVLSALEAFAWMGWLSLSAIIGISIAVIIMSSNNGGAGMKESLPTRSDEGNGVGGTTDMGERPQWRFVRPTSGPAV